MLCDGTTKPISEIEEGDFVLARIEETGELTCQPAVAPYSNPNKALIDVELVDQNGNVEVLESTYNHPFFVLGRGWVRVEHLEVGDIVPTSDGQATVVGLAWKGRLATVYNFGVEQTRSYFVGETAAWVHNCFDWAHIFRNHTPSGETVRQGGANSSKTLFKGFSEDQVKKIVKDAWQGAKKDGKQQVNPATGDVRQRYVGKNDHYDVEIEFYYNHSTKQVESAYPRGQDLVNPYGVE